METINFMHCQFAAKEVEVRDFIESYFNQTSFSIWINGSFGFMVYEKTGSVFRWNYASLDDSWVDIAEVYESEVRIQSVKVEDDEVTEVRISFTNFSLLERYFERLAVKLWKEFPIHKGALQIAILSEKPIFSSHLDYMMDKKKRLDDIEIPLESHDPVSNDQMNESNSSLDEIIKRWVDPFFSNLPKDGSKGDTQESSISKQIKPNNRLKKPRSDALKRVAFALYLIEIGTVNTRIAAAHRAHTTVQSISKYEDIPVVKNYLKEFISDKSLATNYQVRLNKKLNSL